MKASEAREISDKHEKNSDENQLKFVLAKIADSAKNGHYSCTLLGLLRGNTHTALKDLGYDVKLSPEPHIAFVAKTATVISWYEPKKFKVD